MASATPVTAAVFAETFCNDCRLTRRLYRQADLELAYAKRFRLKDRASTDPMLRRAERFSQLREASHRKVVDAEAALEFTWDAVSRAMPYPLVWLGSFVMLERSKLQSGVLCNMVSF